MTTFGSYQKPKTFVALSSFVSAVSKTYPEIYIKFKTARKNPLAKQADFFSYIRLTASSIASQCYWLTPVLLPAGSWEANIISLLNQQKYH